MAKRLFTPFLLASLLLFVFAWVAKSAESPQDVTIISVTSSLDETGGADCTLRDALTTANTGVDTGACIMMGNGSPISISLDAPGPYTLTFANSLTATLGLTGLPNVVADVVLAGNGEKIVRSYAPETPNFRILFVEITGTLQLRNLTLQNGYLDGSDLAGSGAGVFNMGHLSLYNTVIMSNTAVGRGAGLMNYWAGGQVTPTLVLDGSEIKDNLGGALYSTYGTVQIDNSTIHDNHGVGVQSEAGVVQITLSTLERNGIWEGNGGGVKTLNTDFTLLNSTVRNNASSEGAGGLALEGPRVHIINSTINNNAGYGLNGNGGGISGLSNDFRITNATISGNTTETYGGGLYISGTITITHATLSGNAAGFAGDGIYVPDESSVKLYNSILTEHPDDDCFVLGTVLGTTNLIDTLSCGTGASFRAGLVSFFDPILADNGGPTWTHLVLPTSNAVDGVECVLAPDTDQRGIIRPQDGDGDGQYFCDLGAVELDTFILPTRTPTPTPTVTLTPTPVTPTPTSTGSDSYLPLILNQPSAP